MVKTITAYREGKLLSLYVRRVGFFRPKLQLMGRFEQELQKLSPRAAWEKCAEPICRPISPDRVDEVVEVMDLLRRSADPYPELAEALKFYAKKCHFVLSDESAWDTVSDEPQNYWRDEAGTATVEDGAIARAILAKCKEQS